MSLLLLARYIDFVFVIEGYETAINQFKFMSWAWADQIYFQVKAPIYFSSVSNMAIKCVRVPAIQITYIGRRPDQNKK